MYSYEPANYIIVTDVGYTAAISDLFTALFIFALLDWSLEDGVKILILCLIR